MQRGRATQLQYIQPMRMLYVPLAIGVIVLSAVSASAQVKGGEDETGSYEAVEGWPQPWSKPGYIWGSQPAVFAQSPDRIFIGMRGELKSPEPAPGGFNGSWGPTGQRATEPKAELRNSIVVLDRAGKLLEAWTQWDQLFEGSSPHKIRISPYDSLKHVWVVNDGKQLVKTLGEAGVAGDDATHFGMPQDVAFLPDGSILVADGLRNARIAKFDKDGKFVSSFGTSGSGPDSSGSHFRSPSTAKAASTSPTASVAARRSTCRPNQAIARNSSCP